MCKEREKVCEGREEVGERGEVCEGREEVGEGERCVRRGRRC